MLLIRFEGRPPSVAVEASKGRFAGLKRFFDGAGGERIMISVDFTTAECACLFGDEDRPTLDRLTGLFAAVL